MQIGAANQANEIADFLTALDGVADAALRRDWMAGMMSKLPASARKRIEGAGKAGALFKELLAAAIKTASRRRQAAGRARRRHSHPEPG